MCTNCKTWSCSCPEGTELARCACSMNIDCGSCGHTPRVGSEDEAEQAEA